MTKKQILTDEVIGLDKKERFSEASEALMLGIWLPVGFDRIDTFNVSWVYIKKCLFVCIVGVFGAFLVAIIVLRPSTSISEKHLARKISKASDKKAAGRYENIKYNICKIDKQLIIAIQAKEVIFSGHELELKDVFGEKKKIFEEEKAYDQIRQYLSDVAQSRREYIRGAFDECKKEAIHDLEKESLCL